MEDVKKQLSEIHIANRQKHALIGELTVLITRTATNYQMHYSKQNTESNIMYPSASLLFALLEKGGRMPQKQLTNKLPTTRQAITSALNNLEKRGFISRYAHTQDRRKRWVELTDTGVEFLRKNMPLRGKFYDKLMTLINDEETRVAIDVLNKLNKYFEKEIKALERLRLKKNIVHE